MSVRFPEDLQPGALLRDRYRIDRLLGAGGMGVVWRAHDQGLDQPVALKVLPLALTHDPAALEAFRQEAQVAIRLTHPGILRLYNLELEPFPFLLMELHEGQSLDVVAARKKAADPACRGLSADEVARILPPLADALDHAHRMGVIHRDIKPANILVTPGFDSVKLADFGIAAQMRASATHFTQARAIGTPLYLAPEQLEQGRIDPRADIFALAMTFHELLGGTFPEFDHEGKPEVTVPGIAPAAAAALAAALDPLPSNRPASAGLFCHRLLTGLGQTSAPPAATGPLPVQPAPAAVTARRLGGVPLLHRVALVGVALCALLPLFRTGALGRGWIDALFALRGPGRLDPAVCAVNTGRPGLPREELAVLIERCHAAGARTIVLDILLDDATPHPALVAALKRAGNVIAPYSAGRRDGAPVKTGVPAAAYVLAGTGYANPLTGSDGVTRAVALVAPWDASEVALAMRAFMHFRGAPAGAGAVLVNFHHDGQAGPLDADRILPAASLVRAPLPAKAFEGRVVLIGNLDVRTAPPEDLFLLPSLGGPPLAAGAVIHLNLLSALCGGRMLFEGPAWLWGLLYVALAAGLHAVARRRPRRAALAVAALVVALPIAGLLLFHAGVVLPVPALLAVAAAGAGLGALLAR